MSIRSWLRACEKRFLRPLGRRVRGTTDGTRQRSDELGRLERRVEALESLVRELAGLAYLRLDSDPGPAASQQSSAQADAREAA